MVVVDIHTTEVAVVVRFHIRLEAEEQDGHNHKDDHDYADAVRGADIHNNEVVVVGLEAGHNHNESLRWHDHIQRREEGRILVVAEGYGMMEEAFVDCRHQEDLDRMAFPVSGSGHGGRRLHFPLEVVPKSSVRGSSTTRGAACDLSKSTTSTKDPVLEGRTSLCHTTASSSVR